MMFDENDGETEKRERCRGCKYRHMVHTNGGYSFYGCYCRPYTGKRVAEIKECPKEKASWKEHIIRRFVRGE